MEHCPPLQGLPQHLECRQHMLREDVVQPHVLHGHLQAHQPCSLVLLDLLSCLKGLTCLGARFLHESQGLSVDSLHLEEEIAEEEALLSEPPEGQGGQGAQPAPDPADPDSDDEYAA